MAIGHLAERRSLSVCKVGRERKRQKARSAGTCPFSTRETILAYARVGSVWFLLAGACGVAMLLTLASRLNEDAGVEGQ